MTTCRLDGHGKQPAKARGCIGLVLMAQAHTYITRTVAAAGPEELCCFWLLSLAHGGLLGATTLPSHVNALKPAMDRRRLGLHRSRSDLSWASDAWEALLEPWVWSPDGAVSGPGHHADLHVHSEYFSTSKNILKKTTEHITR